MTVTRRFVSLIEALILTVAVQVVSLSTAPAASADVSTAGQHCVLAAGAGQKPVCFSTLSGALGYASAGRVKISEATGVAERDRLIDAANRAAQSDKTSLRATIVIAIHYKGRNYTFESLTLVHSSACPGNPTKVWPNFQPPWNNIFASSKLFAGCRGTAFDNPVIDGPGAAYAYTCEQWLPSFGGGSTMENKMSSFKAWYGGC